MTQYCFLEPLDVLLLRGNKLFGNPGSFGESLVPPWPSVAAGALRSRILVDAGVDLREFSENKIEHPSLGTPARPGAFTLTDFHVARRAGNGAVETCHRLPADLFAARSSGKLVISRMTPRMPAAGLLSSSRLPSLAILSQNELAKGESGYWLTDRGWRTYLNGEPLADTHLIETKCLWTIDPRVGIGLNEATRSAKDGSLFTVQAVAFSRDVGFLVGVQGAELPRSGTVRLGGDGRAAAIHGSGDFSATEPDYEAISRARRCRVVLTTPGIFPGGWQIPGVALDGHWALGGTKGTVIAAAVSRPETVSGWDLATRKPKPAERAAPTGSVYWIEDLDAEPGALRRLVETGLWSAPDENPARRAEGFNRFTFATY